MTYWVEDDRLVGSRPFLFVHDSLMNYVPAPREEWTTREVTRGGKTKTIDVPPARTLAAMDCMDEIMCRGMQPVVRGLLVQTDGSIMRERWE